MQLFHGPGRGEADNFLSLIRRAPSGCCLAFCDQDDVWLPEKLEWAVASLEGAGGPPSLYCSQRWVTDRHLRVRRITAPRAGRIGFEHALVECLPAGNTIVLNVAGAALLKSGARDIASIGNHDWWAYQMITGVGGRVIADPRASLLYRQHGRNVVGDRRDMHAKIRRARMILDGSYRRRVSLNYAALAANAALLRPDNCTLLENLVARRDQRCQLLLTRLLWQSGARRHGKLATVLHYFLIATARA